MAAEVALIDALAAARLTRLVVVDDFPPVKRARDWFLERVGEESTLGDLIGCPWCAGWWISAAVVAARWRFPRLWDPVARALATSLVVGFAVVESERLGDLQAVASAVDSSGKRIANVLKPLEAVRQESRSEDAWREANRGGNPG